MNVFNTMDADTDLSKIEDMLSKLVRMLYGFDIIMFVYYDSNR